MRKEKAKLISNVDNRGNSVGTVTRLGVGELTFSTASRPTLKPMQQPAKNVPGVEEMTRYSSWGLKLTIPPLLKCLNDAVLNQA
jgi:hypothetical protein